MLTTTSSTITITSTFNEGSSSYRLLVCSQEGLNWRSAVFAHGGDLLNIIRAIGPDPAGHEDLRVVEGRALDADPVVGERFQERHHRGFLAGFSTQAPHGVQFPVPVCHV